MQICVFSHHLVAACQQSVCFFCRRLLMSMWWLKDSTLCCVNLIWESFFSSFVERLLSVIQKLFLSSHILIRLRNSINKCFFFAAQGLNSSHSSPFIRPFCLWIHPHTNSFLQFAIIVTTQQSKCKLQKKIFQKPICSDNAYDDRLSVAQTYQRNYPQQNPKMALPVCHSTINDDLTE